LFSLPFKEATLNGDSMVISSAESNSSELQRIAKMTGIQNFMDVAYAYQPSGMILRFRFLMSIAVPLFGREIIIQKPHVRQPSVAALIIKS